MNKSRIGLGTWVFGGWPWNEPNEKECERVVEKALELGVSFVDTAPIYGFGRSEKIVGRALKNLKARDRVVLATKCGLSWEEGKRKIWKDSSQKTILKEIDESLTRLQTDWIDLYQVHWPDPHVSIEETMTLLQKLKEEGKIRMVGVSNFSVSKIEGCLKHAEVQSVQVPYNYFQREIEKELLPFCIKQGIQVITYGTLCKGLLTGKFSLRNKPKDPVRSPNWDPLFEEDRYKNCLHEIENLKEKAKEQGLSMGQWAIRWTIMQAGVTSALVGCRTVKQTVDNVSQGSGYLIGINCG